MRRVTIEATAIAIERDGSLVVQAPDDLAEDALTSAVATRLPWVHHKLADRRLRADLPSKEFIGDETFRYLGRNYRLAFGEGDGVALKNGRLVVPNDRRNEAERQLRQWYVRRGEQWLPGRLAPWCQRVGAPQLPVRVLDLGYRWASLSENEILNVHWQAMSLPPSTIDYLIVHELAHLRHPHHDRAFWKDVLKTMPDADQRRVWLRRHGGGW